MKIKHKWTLEACKAYALKSSLGPDVSYDGMCAALDVVAPLIIQEVAKACVELVGTRAVTPDTWSAVVKSIARLIRDEMSSVLREV